MLCASSLPTKFKCKSIQKHVDNACGDTGHPLAVKQKMHDFERFWKDLGGSWGILGLVLVDFD